ncbi:fused MFS/spermidine synthase [Acidaminococcus fermentans DSM 20731]|uniref:Methyltransferase type 12 n=2 Tax=Acidaminococcus fermentans TaxID=905 RepID=D2RJ22_ACIFV|nr:fused MFS/spermidine synthase [Acidaminococcus fermentans]ADB47074.1 Methyltransferase type 12 [Acidaminococcus fermentans DSM 20731]UEA72324.1 fused MFS/spermidine synthase [Acidaminococcus fermentans DSM 20731]
MDTVQSPAVAPGGRRLLQNQYYLYLTEFFAGMAVMAVEIGAQRLISPYFSSSQVVWTIIIGMIMIAMAGGNVYGGKTADKDPNPDKLYGRILFSSIWLALIPFLGKYIIVGISAVVIFSVNANYLIIAAIATCLLLFVFPLFLLGTVTPSLAKYTMDSLSDNGKIVGTLGAMNTIGSILGTFLPTFVTIPAIGTNLTFLIFSGILLVLSAVYFLSSGKRLRKVGAAAILFVAACLLGYKTDFAFWKSREGLLYEGESVYNYLRVQDSPKRTVLSTNVLFGVQSVLEKSDGLTGMYYDYALTAPFLTKSGTQKAQDVLILGMGSGTYARQLLRYLPGTKVAGVEIDRKITDLAHQYFQLPAQVPVTEYDGRAYLNEDPQKYDVIMVDAYQDITIPFQMSSVEFFQSVRQHLKPGGVMVVNLNMHGTEQGGIADWLADTVAGVFPEVMTIDVPGNTNRELFAGERGLKASLAQNSQTVRDPQLKDLLATIGNRAVLYHSGGRKFTDDKAPVELLGMQELDGLIRQEAERYKEIYRKEGIEGVLQDL